MKVGDLVTFRGSNVQRVVCSEEAFVGLILEVDFDCTMTTNVCRSPRYSGTRQTALIPTITQYGMIFKNWRY